MNSDGVWVLSLVEMAPGEGGLEARVVVSQMLMASKVPAQVGSF